MCFTYPNEHRHWPPTMSAREWSARLPFLTAGQLLELFVCQLDLTGPHPVIHLLKRMRGGDRYLGIHPLYAGVEKVPPEFGESVEELLGARQPPTYKWYRDQALTAKESVDPVPLDKYTFVQVMRDVQVTTRARAREWNHELRPPALSFIIFVPRRRPQCSRFRGESEGPGDAGRGTDRHRSDVRPHPSL